MRLDKKIVPPIVKSHVGVDLEKKLFIPQVGPDHGSSPAGAPAVAVVKMQITEPSSPADQSLWDVRRLGVLLQDGQVQLVRKPRTSKAIFDR
jgi:hypothetical protein